MDDQKNWRTFEDVLAFAVIAHSEQRRKFNGRPYITHPLRVAFLFMEWFPNENQDFVLAAILHDVVEDCPSITVEHIREKFGEPIASLVEELTNEPKDIRISRAETKERDRERIKNISAAAKCIKAADRLCNLSELLTFNGEIDFKTTYLNESELLVKECFDGYIYPNIVSKLYEKIQEVRNSL